MKCGAKTFIQRTLTGFLVPILVLSSCSQDLVSGRRFACTSDDTCGAGFKCGPSGYCVPAAEVGEPEDLPEILADTGLE